MKQYTIILIIFSCFILTFSTTAQNKSELRIKLSPRQLGYKNMLSGMAIDEGSMGKYIPEKISAFPFEYEIEKIYRIAFQKGQYNYYISLLDSIYLKRMKNFYGENWLEIADSIYTNEWVDCVVSICVLKDSIGKHYLVVDTNNDEDFTNDIVVEFKKETIGSGKFMSEKMAAKCNPTIEYYDGKQIRTREISFVIFKSQSVPQYLFCSMLDRPVGKINIEGKDIQISLHSIADIEYNKYSFLFADLNCNGSLDENDFYGQLTSPVNIQNTFYLPREIDRLGNFILMEADTSHFSVKEKQSEQSLLSRVAGKPAPDFKAFTLDSIEFRLSNFKGNYVLLHFWSSWCGPCIKEIPHIQKLFKEYESRGLKIVSIGNEGREKSHQYLKVQSKNWIHISKTNRQEVEKLYYVTSLPTLYLLNKEGYIIETSFALRGNRLNKTMEKYFPKL